jgi:hypothetical protein
MRTQFQVVSKQTHLTHSFRLNLTHADMTTPSYLVDDTPTAFTYDHLYAPADAPLQQPGLAYPASSGAFSQASLFYPPSSYSLYSAYPASVYHAPHSLTGKRPN